MQNVLNYSTIQVATHFIPQAIAGIIVNIIAGAVLHRVSNRLLVGIGALSYLGCMLLLATMEVGSSYWAFIFPALILSVIGADLQFNVANVSSSSPSYDVVPMLIRGRCMSSHPFPRLNNPLQVVYSTPSQKLALQLLWGFRLVFTTRHPRVVKHCRPISGHIR